MYGFGMVQQIINRRFFRRRLSLKHVLKQMLNHSGIDVDEEDLANVESQLKRLDSAKTSLKKLHLKEVVPAMVFRVEVEDE